MASVDDLIHQLFPGKTAVAPLTKKNSFPEVAKLTKDCNTKDHPVHEKETMEKHLEDSKLGSTNEEVEDDKTTIKSTNVDNSFDKDSPQRCTKDDQDAFRKITNGNLQEEKNEEEKGLASNHHHSSVDKNDMLISIGGGPVGATRNSFDEDSSFDEEQDQEGSDRSKKVGVVAATRSTLPITPITHVVPFPTIPSTVSLVLATSCVTNHSCTLSSLGNSNLRHPALQKLMDLSDAKEYHVQQQRNGSLSSGELMYQMKGAFQCCAKLPQVGNGVDPQEGCPFLFCARCDNVVIRLQSASWIGYQQDQKRGDDDIENSSSDSVVDLYLVVRNYYPDWSKLASLDASKYAVVRTNQDGENKPATTKKGASTTLLPISSSLMSSCLQKDEDCAAYCCQCSWFTATSEKRNLWDDPDESMFSATRFESKKNGEKKNVIVTSLSDVGTTRLLPVEMKHYFSEGRGTRPPLWVCRGHL